MSTREGEAPAASDDGRAQNVSGDPANYGQAYPARAGVSRDATWIAAAVDAILPRLNLVGAPDVKGEQRAWCPLHPDGQGQPPHEPDFEINVREGVWRCGVCGEGGGLRDLAKRLGVRLPSARREQNTAETPTRDPIDELCQRRGWTAAALRALGAKPHPDFTGQVRIPMRDETGAVVGYKNRRADGGEIKGHKSHTEPGGKHGLFMPWPLPEGAVLVVEGEADAAAALSADWPAVVGTAGRNPGQVGRQALQRLLAGRDVTLAPHPDEAGRGWLDEVGALLANARAQVRFVAADAKRDLDARLRAAPDRMGTLRDLAAAAMACKPARAAARDETCAERLLALASGDDLFHDPQGAPYALVQDGARRSTWPVGERGCRYRALLVQRHCDSEGKPPHATALTSVLEALAARAVWRGATHEVALRVAEYDHAIFVDLANDAGEAVRCTGEGWEVVTDDAVRWRRPPDMRALPAPVHGGSVEPLRDWLNLSDDADFILCASWLLAAMRPGYPYPVLALGGEQGSAKSTAARILRFLIDPTGDDGAGLTRQPREERDLAAAVGARHVLALDNVGRLPHWLSDALSSLATGTGWSARTLYTNLEETVIYAKRPIILNGIPDVATRPDLLDRSLVVTLPAIRDATRKPEEAVWAPVRELAGFVLGGLLDAVAMALRNLPTLAAQAWPRMCDFARWIAAAEPALPWAPGAFEAAYRVNRDTATASALDASLVYAPLLAMLTANTPATWEGTATELLGHLRERVSDKVVAQKDWPSDGARLSGELRRLAPALRADGIEVEFTREGRARRQRTITLRVA